MEAPSEYVHVFERLAKICMLSRCLLTKFLHRSSVESLLLCVVGWVPALQYFEHCLVPFHLTFHLGNDSAGLAARRAHPVELELVLAGTPEGQHGSGGGGGGGGGGRWW